MEKDPRRNRYIKADAGNRRPESASSDVSALKASPDPNRAQVSEPRGAVDPADRIEGRNPVLEALRAGRTINKIWLARPENGRLDPTAQRILALARESNVPVMEVPRVTLDQMSVTHAHQGVIAQAASHDYAELDEVLADAAERGEAPFLVILDELKDAYNLGSVLRISDAAGVHAVIIPRHRSIGLDAVVAKASAGAVEYVPVCRVTNLSQTIADLKKNGFWIAGTDAEGTMTYDKAPLTGALAVVIGSEGEGMSRLVRESCDFLISIPMKGHVNSLNAAVAAGIVVFEAAKQRRNGKE